MSSHATRTLFEYRTSATSPTSTFHSHAEVLSAKDTQIAALQAEIAAQKTALAAKDCEIAELKKKLEARGAKTA